MRSLAGVSLLDRFARLTLHLAAPDEATVTAFLKSDLLDSVSPPAAQRLASLRAVGAPSTPASPRPEYAPIEVLAAVVGRPVDEDQLGVGDRFPSLALLAPPQDVRLRRRLGRNLDGTLVLSLHRVADFAEVRQRPPAGTDSAGSGDSVASTFGLHQRRQDLNTDKRPLIIQSNRRPIR